MKNVVIDDIKFSDVCRKYGINENEYEIYGNVILLNTNNDLYILLDKKYNTIGIYKKNIEKMYDNKLNFVNNKYYEYSNFKDAFYPKKNFGYPFENYTLKQIIDLSSIVEVEELDYDHSSITKINNKSYYRNQNENETYFQLLSYIKFLGKEIEKYFLISYQLQSMGFDVVDVYSYTRVLIKRINNCIDYFIDKKIRPYPNDIAKFIGQDHKNISYYELYDIANLLIKNKGYSVIQSDFLEKNNNEIENLSNLSTDLLSILNEVDEKEEILDSKDLHLSIKRNNAVKNKQKTLKKKK